MSKYARNTNVSCLAFGPWRVDPDHRQDRRSGPVTVRKMTPEEVEKYRDIKDSGKKPAMVGVEGMKRRTRIESKEKGESIKMPTLLKADIKSMAQQGKTVDEMVEYYKPSYPKMKESLLRGKILLYMSDKKIGGSKGNRKAESNAPEQPKRLGVKPKSLISQSVNGLEYEILAEELAIRCNNGPDDFATMYVSWAELENFIEDLSGQLLRRFSSPCMTSMVGIKTS